MKNIWRKNFSIPRVDYQMPYPAMEAFYRSQVHFLGRAAIVSRELKIPCIVGLHHITQALKDGDRVEVDAIKEV